MRFWTVWLIVICTGASLVGAANHTLDTKSWFREHRIKNFVTDSFLITAIINISKLDCARRCTALDECISFFYTHPTETCRMHSHTFELGVPLVNSRPETGTYFYANKCNHAGYKSLGVHSSKYIKTTFTHTTSYRDAEKFCNDAGGALLKVNDETEKGILLPELLGIVGMNVHASVSDQAFWIDARRHLKSSPFKWSDGTDFLAALWAPGEPEVSDLKNCVIIVPFAGLGVIECTYSSTEHKLYPLCQCVV